MKASLRRLQNAQRGSIATLVRQHAADSSAAASSLVELHGWVRTIRRQKKVSFISLHDGSDWKGIQAVVPSALLERLEQGTAEAAFSSDSTHGGLGSGASVQLIGRLVEKQGGTVKGKGKERQTDEQELEMQVESLRVLGGSDGKVRAESRKHVHTA